MKVVGNVRGHCVRGIVSRMHGDHRRVGAGPMTISELEFAPTPRGCLGDSYTLGVQRDDASILVTPGSGTEPHEVAHVGRAGHDGVTPLAHGVGHVYRLRTPGIPVMPSGCGGGGDDGVQQAVEVEALILGRTIPQGA